MAESLRDAIAAALKSAAGEPEVDHEDGSHLWYVELSDAVPAAEAAARRWFADWLRSDEAYAVAAAGVDKAYGSLYRPLGVARSALSALADALTKENPRG